MTLDADPCVLLSSQAISEPYSLRPYVYPIRTLNLTVFTHSILITLFRSIFRDPCVVEREKNAAAARARTHTHKKLANIKVRDLETATSTATSGSWQRADSFLAYIELVVEPASIGGRGRGRSRRAFAVSPHFAQRVYVPGRPRPSVRSPSVILVFPSENFLTPCQGKLPDLCFAN